MFFGSVLTSVADTENKNNKRTPLKGQANIWK
jgi:hypothetical protein